MLFFVVVVSLSSTEFWNIFDYDIIETDELNDLVLQNCLLLALHSYVNIKHLLIPWCKMIVWLNKDVYKLKNDKLRKNAWSTF